MLSNPFTGQRVSLALAAVCGVWLTIYVFNAEALYRRLGDLAHALTFLAIFLGLSGVAVSFLFRGMARVRRALATGDEVFGRWRVTPQEWADFVGRSRPEGIKDRSMTLFLIAVFAVVICGAMAIMNPDDWLILAGIAIFIMAVDAFGFWLGDMIERRQLVYRGGEVVIGPRGVMVNGVLHVWSLFGSAFDRAWLVEGAPAMMHVSYRYWARSGPQFVDVRIPAPPQTIETARLAVDRLMAAAGRRPARLRRRAGMHPV